MSKSIRVQTNDPTKSNIRLQISGQVEKFVTIQPMMASMIGFSSEPIESKVRIIPEEKYPFKILEVKAEKGGHIAYKLEEKTFSEPPEPGKPKSEEPEAEKPKIEKSGYELTVENIKKDPGRYRDFIYLKTDSEVRPEIVIKVFGNIFGDKKQQSKGEK